MGEKEKAEKKQRKGVCVSEREIGIERQRQTNRETFTERDRACVFERKIEKIKHRQTERKREKTTIRQRNIHREREI